MSTTRSLMPAPGRRVRKPLTGQLLAAAGETVVWSSYWHRLYAAGDVIDVPPPPAKPAPAAPAKPAASEGAA